MDACVIGAEPGDLAEEARGYEAEILVCPKSPNLYAFSRNFFRMLTDKGYNVVHSHGETWSGATLRGAVLAGIPIRIAHIRDIGHVGSEDDKTALLRAGRAVVTAWGRHWVQCHATHVMGVSEAALDQLWPEWRSQPDRFLVWTAGVDTGRFSEVCNVERRETASAPVIICVGNFFLRSKRQDMAVRIFATVRAVVPQARLVFVGTGTHESACRYLASELGVSDAVDFLGPRSRADIPELLRSAGIFLCCSESEGLPNVLLEAQAAGLPVVATDIAAHREALSPVLFPYLFGRENQHEAASKITAILTNPDLANKLGKAGRAYVSHHYSASSRIRLLEDLYVSWVNSEKESL